MKDYEFQQKFVEWLNGDATVFQTNLTRRKALVARDGNKCSVCGIHSWNDKPITFEVEHKDGNSENNLHTNLCLICPNCHSQTSTYKGKNKGNGRFKRMERYRAGLSF